MREEVFQEEERYKGTEVPRYQGMRLQGYKATRTTGEEEKGVTQKSRTGRLVRFLFCPPRLGPVPPAWVAVELAGVPVFNRFAARLAKSPPDLVTRLGMARSSAYYEAGCPLELCDHAAARDLWRVIYEEAMGKERYGTGV